MLNPQRPHHQRVLSLLDSLSADFLEKSACFFGGGTRIVLELNEYRESLDVDFLCADQDGYRELRNQVSNNSLGGIFAHEPTLLREVRADMYGIRTFIDIDSQPMKFEIVREARLPLAGTFIDSLPIACLDHSSAVAEKFLANTDRGVDESTRSRDLIDLAYMVGSWSDSEIKQGLELAEAAYGESVKRQLKSALELFTDEDYRKQCLTELEVSNRQALEIGLSKLDSIAR